MVYEKVIRFQSFLSLEWVPKENNIFIAVDMNGGFNPSYRWNGCLRSQATYQQVADWVSFNPSYRWNGCLRVAVIATADEVIGFQSFLSLEWVPKATLSPTGLALIQVSILLIAGMGA